MSDLTAEQQAEQNDRIAERFGDDLPIMTMKEKTNYVRPSVKYGMPLQVGLMVGICVFALVVAGLLFYWVMHVDRRKKEAKQAKKDEKAEELQNKLECKPFSGTEHTTLARHETVEISQSSSLDSADDDPSPVVPVPHPPAGLSFRRHAEGPCCAICDKVFEDGQPVVESNNPSCKHVHHKNCMDSWLQFQNSCPVCNQPYVLQTV